MGERKIRIRQLPDGMWAAGRGEGLDFYVACYRIAGPAEAKARVVSHGLGEAIGVAATPWEASALARYMLCADVPIEWETLPWSVQREAHGITQGVCELLGAGRDARRAIGKAMLTRCADATRRSMAAAAGAVGCLLDGGEVPSRDDVEKALEMARAAARGLPGYGPVVRLLGLALNHGYPDRRRARRLVERAWSALVAANARNDIAPDSR